MAKQMHRVEPGKKYYILKKKCETAVEALCSVWLH